MQQLLSLPCGHSLPQAYLEHGDTAKNAYLCGGVQYTLYKPADRVFMIEAPLTESKDSSSRSAVLSLPPSDSLPQACLEQSDTAKNTHVSGGVQYTQYKSPYKSDDPVFVVDSPLTENTTSSSQSSAMRSAASSHSQASQEKFFLDDCTRREEKMLHILEQEMCEEKDTTTLLSTSSLIKRAREKYKFYPSRIEIYEARLSYGRKYPEVQDDEAFLRIPPVTVFGQGAQLPEAGVDPTLQMPCGPNTLKIEVGAFKISIEGPMTYNLEKLLSTINNALRNVA